MCDGTKKYYLLKHAPTLCIDLRCAGTCVCDHFLETFYQHQCNQYKAALHQCMNLKKNAITGDGVYSIHYTAIKAVLLRIKIRVIKWRLKKVLVQMPKW